MHLSHADREWLEPRFPDTGGFVTVRPIERPDPRRMGHIPRTTASVSRLAGAAADVIRTNQCDVCFAYYLEPYGVAAYLAHKQTGVPYALKHAGSDIDRLMLVPDLAETYREVWRTAAAVMTREELAGRFLQMGVDPSRFAIGLKFEIPDIFNPGHAPLDVAAILANAEGKAFAHIPPSMRRNDSPDPATPTIGIYGKVGETKGSFDLVRALRKVKDQGLRFNLLCMGNGVQFPRFVEEVEAAGLTAETWLLPFLPHWRVPAFLRSCTAVCFLEREFPVKIHGPGVPQEIMSCGVCLIVSGEIDAKQRRRFDFRPGEAALVVKDPKDHDSLADALARVIRDPEWAAAVGRAGYESLQQRRAAAAATAPASAAVDPYEHLLETVTARRPVTGVVGTTADAARRPETVARQFAMRALLPRCARLLDASASPLWNAFVDGEGASNRHNAAGDALAFASFIIDEMKKPAVAVKELPYLPDVAALEADILRSFSRRDGVPRDGRVRSVTRPATIPVEGEWSRLRPERDRARTMHQARVDLIELERIFREGQHPPARLPAADLRILIVPLSNFSVKLFSVSTTTDTLLRLCDGTRTADEVVAEVRQTSRAEGSEDGVRAAIARLHEEGVLSFH